MMNRGLMRRQMFAMGGPVRMEDGGLASLQAEADRLGITVAELLSRMQSDNRRMSVFEMEKMQKFKNRLREEMDRPSPPTARGLPQRPIKLEEGGAAGFPDFNDDGAITKADILIGRGVELAMGGEPMMAQQAAMMQAPMPQAPMPQDPSMDQAMAQAAQVGVDPAAVEGMLNQVSEGIGNLDEAEDFEQVMNSMRGDEAPISERYAELAEVVGEEDAQATPESVLALVQPVMQIAQVDQGIGGLAQEEMSAPVEGNMAGGIMSTVNMGEEVPAPVNFNQGGPVVAMANGGNPLKPFYNQALDLRQSILSPEGQQQSFDDQKRMTQAQMLFDIAQGALAFATPGERQMSAAERLAQVAQPVIGSIGARAGELQKFKQGQEAEERAMKLSALTSAETQLAAKQDRDFRASESALNRAQELLVQERNLDFKEKSQESDQNFRSALLDQQAQIDIAAAALANVNSQEALKLKAELDRKAIQLQSTLRRHEISMGLQNDLKKMKVANTYDLEKMEKGFEFNKDLADHRAGLEEIAAQKKMDHDIAMFSLKDIADSERQVTDQEFQLLIQQNAQSFTSDENAINRAVEAAQRKIDNAFKTAADERAEKTLTIAQRAQALDEAYKAEKIAIDKAAADAVRLGSKSDTAAITVITSPTNLEKYRNKTMGDFKDTYEQTILNYLGTREADWNEAEGKFVMKKVGLTQGVLDAIKKGDPDFFNRLQSEFQLGDAGGVSSEATGGGGGTGTGTQETGTKAPKNLNEATIEIFNPNGTVNLDSEVWKLTPSARFNPDLDYGQVIGSSRLYPGLVTMASEGYSELADGVPTEVAENHREAQKTLNALANDLLQFATNISDDRVLKFVQELIEEETQELRPGGFLFKTDAGAAKTLLALRDGLENGMRKIQPRLTEYGGDSSKYTKAQVTSARANMDEMKVLLNEILAFEEGFAFQRKATTGPPKVGGVNQSTENTKKQILQMIVNPDD
tara:strand:- start:537 stop:3464 length:2928 start_codon:yes stop_codon:yes gene_type:complete